MTDETLPTSDRPQPQPQPDAPAAAGPTTDADRRQAMERMLGLLTAAPAAALLFDPRRAEAWGGGSFE